MFTGIIEEVGRIEKMSRYGQAIRLSIQANLILTETKVGDSIAVNGICLTVTDLTSSSFSADVMPETLRKSSLSHLREQSRVNLERALKLTDRLGGHIVNGHIDGTGSLISIRRENNAIVLQISASMSLLKYMIQKGSVALDGVSLTIVDVDIDKSTFTVSIIPHSARMTIINSYKLGDQINIECDVVGKYVETLLKLNQHPHLEQGQLKQENQTEQITLDYLKLQGF